MTKVTLLGHELELLPFRGRKGAAYLRGFQNALDKLLSAMQSVVDIDKVMTGKSLDMNKIATNMNVLNALSGVALSEEFTGDVLPLFWMCSTESLSKQAALKIIDEIDFRADSAFDILNAVSTAMSGSGPSDDEREAFEEAVKKSNGEEGGE